MTAPEYPPCEQLGLIGDRRTAASISPEGKIVWLCLPNYDSAPLFGSLLDAKRGGHWDMGPAAQLTGQQSYAEESAVLVTSWRIEGWHLELTDAFAWPEIKRSSGRSRQRVLIRRLRCLQGPVDVKMEFHPRYDFVDGCRASPDEQGVTLHCGPERFRYWTSVVDAKAKLGTQAFTMAADEEVWAVLSHSEADHHSWSVAAARDALDETLAYWREWNRKIVYHGPRAGLVRRSAVTIHLLGYAPTGALVAAPTTSLPERIGGDKNYDYRFAWVRDASLSLAIQAMLGDLDTAERYMDWLASLDSSSDMPLQVLYRLDGGTDAAQIERPELSGYKNSKPVLFGNHAAQQDQIDSLGWFADCASIYLEQGGAWKDEYRGLLRRLANYTVGHWRKPGNGLWELSAERHYVSSKVMAWVLLERTCKVFERLGEEIDTGAWHSAMEDIKAEVLDKGWSDQLQSFRQHYDDESLDASTLLIPLMGFLPADDPRCVATIRRIEQDLTINGLVHRFDPASLPGEKTELKLGEFEGAFLPCTFWMAAALAEIGEHEKAGHMLETVENTAGELGLFAEEMDARRLHFLGNTPLMFSHAEYLKAVLAIAMATPIDTAKLMFGRAERRLRRWAGGS